MICDIIIMSGPRFYKFVFLAATYPIVYCGWVTFMKDTWVLWLLC